MFLETNIFVNQSIGKYKSVLNLGFQVISNMLIPFSQNFVCFVFLHNRSFWLKSKYTKNADITVNYNNKDTLQSFRSKIIVICRFKICENIWWTLNKYWF